MFACFYAPIFINFLQISPKEEMVWMNDFSVLCCICTNLLILYNYKLFSYMWFVFRDNLKCFLLRKKHLILLLIESSESLENLLIFRGTLIYLNQLMGSEDLKIFQKLNNTLKNIMICLVCLVYFVSESFNIIIIFCWFFCF